MFGNNDTNNQTQDNGAGFAPPSAPVPDYGNGGLSLPPTTTETPATPPPTTDDHAALDDLAASAPTPPSDTPVTSDAPTDSSTSDSSSASSNEDLLDDKDSELLGIKQKALQQLSPLVGHLDQSPEEKFRTLMMMIQASDDQTLLNEAYDAAEKISDEKERAQALLDIVNEINYFTQQKDN